LTIALYWLLQMFFLGGSRLAYRLFRHWRTKQHAKGPEAIPTLIVGRAADADVLLRAIESGAVKEIWPSGILSPSPADPGGAIRGVAGLGNPDELAGVVADLEMRGSRIGRLVLTPSGLAPEAPPEAVVMAARRLGIPTSRLPSLEGEGEAIRLAPIDVEDLLL